MPTRSWKHALRAALAIPPLALVPGPGRRFHPTARAGRSDDGGLRRFFEQSADPMLTLDPGHIILEANEAAARFLSRPLDQLLSASVLEVDLLARVLTSKGILHRLKTDPPPVFEEVSVADAEGQPIQCRIEAIPLGGGRTLLHIQDTSPLLRIRDTLRAAERLHRAVFEAMPQVVWSMALPEERLLEISPAVEPIFGYEPAAFRDHPERWEELVHPADRERVRGEFRNGLGSGRPFEIHFTGLHRDHRDLPGLVNHVVPVADERGWVDRCQGFIEDRSGRHRLEETLRTAEGRLRHVLETVDSGVLMLEPGERGIELALCNRRLADMLRLDEPPKPGTPFAQAPEALRAVAHGAHSEHEFERRALSEELSEDTVELNLEMEGVDQPQDRRMLRRFSGPVRDPYGAVVGRIVTVEDVTASWLLQRRLTQAQKMESMGRLAGGVAHDFNNLLGTIMGFGSLLLEETPEGDPKRAGLVEIVKASERASRLTAALLAFSRSARFERLPVDLNRVIEDSYQLLRSTLEPSVAIEVKPDPALPPLLGDALLLEQMIVNLVQEVRDRLASGGSLRLATRSFEERRAPGAPAGQPGSQRMAALEIEVSGDKPGARDADAPEPAGGGRPGPPGLALTIAEDIARAHGGYLITGPEAAPALFRVVLPVTAAEERPRVVVESATAHGHETILVVDDEPALLALASTGLKQRGFDVVTAQSGEQALEILRTAASPVDLVFLDLSLPGLSGERVLRAIRDFRRDLPVIIASGYATLESQAAWSAAGAQGFVGKPYRIQDVAARLREVLDRAHGRAR